MTTDIIKKKSVKKMDVAKMENHISEELEYATMVCEVNNIISDLTDKLYDTVKLFTKFHIFTSYYAVLHKSSFFRDEINLQYVKPEQLSFYNIIKANPFDIDFSSLLSKDLPEPVNNIFNIIENTMIRLINSRIFDLETIVKKYKVIGSKTSKEYDSYTDYYYGLHFISETMLSGDMSLANLIRNLILIPVRENLLFVKNNSSVSKTKNTLFKTISKINSLMLTMGCVEQVVENNINMINTCMKKHVEKELFLPKDYDEIEIKDFFNMFKIEQKFHFEISYGYYKVTQFDDPDSDIKYKQVFNIKSICKNQTKDNNDICYPHHI